MVHCKSFTAPAKVHPVYMFAYPDAQILDITGPLEVFSRASRWLQDNGLVQGEAYRVQLVAAKTGLIRCSNGLQILADGVMDDIQPASTVLISGGIGFRALLGDEQLLAWLRHLEPRVQRLGSVCTGAFVLAAAGLLDNMTSTTHWAYCDELARLYPATQVDPDILFTQQGKIFTAAGVTAGIDMALAMVEQDWGQRAALETAQQLVMYLKRPAGQAQLSRQLLSQKSELQSIQELLVWIVENPATDLSINALANRVAMSSRNFARRFNEETGMTPAKFVEQTRFDIACRKLEQTQLSIEAVARYSGFNSSDALRRIFMKRTGISPKLYRARFQQLVESA